MKKYLILPIIIGLLGLYSGIAFAAPTSTTVQNLFITGIKETGSCLVPTATGLVATSTCGSGSGFTNAATSTSAGVFTVSTTTTKITITIPPSHDAFYAPSAYVVDNTGNWAGTWQGVNSSTFYLASNPSGYISVAPATGTIITNGGTITGPAFTLTTSTASNGFTFTSPGAGALRLTIPSNLGFFTNDLGFITGAPATGTIIVNGGTIIGPAFTITTSTQSGKFTITSPGAGQLLLTIPPASDYLVSSTLYVSSFNGSTGAVTGVGSLSTSTAGFTLSNSTGSLSLGLKIPWSIANGGTATSTTPTTNALMYFDGTYITGTSTSFLSGNQTVTLSGDVTGSGATAITTTIASPIHVNTINASTSLIVNLTATNVSSTNANFSTYAQTPTLIATTASSTNVSSTNIDATGYVRGTIRDTNAVAYINANDVASSSLSFNVQNATTTGGQNEALAYASAPFTLNKVFCYTSNVTTTFSVYRRDALATTTNNILLSSLACGTAGQSTATFTSSTIPAGTWIVAVTTSTTGGSASSSFLFLNLQKT